VEKQNRVVSAYQAEANQINALITKVSQLKVTGDSAIEAQRALLIDLNNNLVIASKNYDDLYKQIQEGGKKYITAAELEKAMQAIIDIETKGKKTLTSMAKEQGMNQEEIEKQRLQLEQNTANSLQNLWKQNGIEIARDQKTNNVVAWNLVKDAIDRANVSQEEYNRKQQEQKDKDKRAKDAEQAEIQALEIIKESKLQVALLDAQRLGDQEKIKKAEQDIAEAQLQSEQYYKNASDETKLKLQDQAAQLKG